LSRRAFSPAPKKKVQDNRQNDAEDNACCNGKIEAKSFFLDPNVARQMTEKFYLGRDKHYQPENDEHRACDY
jgi:hypothetical protein